MSTRETSQNLAHRFVNMDAFKDWRGHMNWAMNEAQVIFLYLVLKKKPLVFELPRFEAEAGIHCQRGGRLCIADVCSPDDPTYGQLSLQHSPSCMEHSEQLEGCTLSLNLQKSSPAVPMMSLLGCTRRRGYIA